MLTHSSYQAGYDVGGSLGFKSEPLRYEGELTYMKAQLNSFKVSGIKQTGVSGNSDGFFALANVYYDFAEVVPAIQPFLGVGIGYGWVQATLSSTGPIGSPTFSGANNAFAYQGTAGLTYNFAENYALDIAYRYLSTTHIGKLDSRFQANLANLGITYRFDGALYK